MVKVGVIGLGMIGQDHLKRLNSVIKGVKIAAVCDVNKKLADDTARSFNANAFYEHDALINDRNVDAILICSIGPVHKDQILAAIKHDKPIFCEKPLASRSKEAQEIIDAEIKSGKRMLQLGFMRRFDPGYIALKQTIDSGILGEILLMHCAHRNKSVPESYKFEMPVNDSSTHEIDIIRYLLNEEIVRVRVDLPKKKTKNAYSHQQDPFIIIFETESGVRIDDELFVNCSYGYDIRCDVIGENGTTELTEQSLTYTRSSTGVSRNMPQTCMERFATAYDKEIQHFIDNINNNEKISGPSSWDGLMNALVCDAGLASIQDGLFHDVIIPKKPELYK